MLGADDPRWASFLADARHDFYHLPAYVALCAVQEGGEARALLVATDRRAMLLPLVVRPIPGGGHDATSPYGYPGPLLSAPDDPAFLQDALLEGVRLLESRGLVSLFVRFHPLLNAVPPDGVGHRVHGGDTVSVNLALTAEELWRQTRAGHRNEINHALRAGYAASFDEKWVHYDEFRRLYRATMMRVSAASYYLFDDAYFDGLRAALEDRLRLCVVKVDGAVAAAGLFVETCGLVQFHLSGSDPAYARERPTKLMLHFVRTWAKERGDRELHLGGGVGAGDDSLLHFKAGFSSLRYPFFTLRIVVNRAEYVQLVRSRDPFADPEALDDFFPLYRRP